MMLFKTSTGLGNMISCDLGAVSLLSVVVSRLTAMNIGPNLPKLWSNYLTKCRRLRRRWGQVDNTTRVSETAGC